MKLTLPIYYTITFKTKKDKTILVGLNYYRNAHYMILNKIKHYYHELIFKQVTGLTDPLTNYKVSYKVYLRNKASDGPNVRSIIEKFALDGLVEAGVLEDDNVKYLRGDTSEYFIDKENPRCELEIKGI